MYKYNDYDDIYQEAIILMHKTISRFNEKFGKTFTRFYELVLRRRIQYLKSLEPKYDLVEEIFGHGYYDNNNDEEEVLLEQLTDFEREVYQNHFVLNKKIAVIAENNNLESKQIYNAIFRIKEKYKNML